MNQDEIERKYDFIEDIFPSNLGNGHLGSLGMGERSLEIKPFIVFQSKELDETFKSLLEELTDSTWNSITRSIDREDDQSKMYNAFQMFFDEFLEYTPEKLSQTVDHLLNNIILSVLVYESSENMQRAFSNMNSYGVNLTEPELIKAEIYGEVRKVDRELADEISDYWIDNLEKTKWTSNFIVGPGPNKTHLFAFLEAFYEMKNKWKQPISRKGNSPRNNDPHWLRDGWRIILEQNRDDFRSFWDNFKKSVTLFETMVSRDRFSSGSADWELNYTCHNWEGSYQHSILLKIADVLKNEELIKALRLINKYSFYLFAVTGNHRNLHQAIMRADSFLLKDTFSYEDIENALIKMEAPKSRWLPEEKIAKIISEREYKNSDSKMICELFVYITNQMKIKDNETSSLFNTRSKNSVSLIGRTREHILSQTSREQMNEKEKVHYAFMTSRIGNVLVISADKNSSASNKPIDKKIDMYLKSSKSAWGQHWVPDFLDDFAKAGNKWGYEEIENRSNKIGNLIASYLSIEAPIKNPHSAFSELHNDYSAGDVFVLGVENSPQYTLSCDGELISDNSEVCTKPKSFTGILEIPSQWREHIYHVDKEGARTRCYTKTDNIKISSASIKSIFLIADSEGVEVEGSSNSAVIRNYIRHLLKEAIHDNKIMEIVNDQSFTMLVNKGFIEDRVRCSKKGAQYAKITDNVYIANRPVQAIKDLIEKISVKTGLTIQLKELDKE